MEENCFIFNNVQYYPGTLVEIKDELRKKLHSYSILRFSGYNEETKLYYFTSKNNIMEIYKITETQLRLYIIEIRYAVVMQKNVKQKLDPRYIAGIVDAWIWYILVMFFAIFIKGAHNTITLWIVATCIFFNWRKRKMNGE